ncbi:MAG: c-type cytochrome [Chloroflexi bacterium]|nr:c-type cytochrome [Chloroflexota bacterium]
MGKKGRLIGIVSFAVVVGGGAVGWWWLNLPGPIDHPQAARFAHAATGAKSACESCHVTAIPFTNCSDCHATPPVNVTNPAGTITVQIAHHKPGGAGGIACGDCHAVTPNDARYIKVPTADHNFCGTCHTRTHSSAAASPSPTQTTSNAAQLFATNCAVCHGANRQGGFGPALTQAALAGKSDASLVNTVTNGKGNMPAWGTQLTADEIAALVQYLKNTP